MTEPKRIERKGLTIDMDGVPTLLLAHPIMTRPQDWEPRARAILWRAALEQRLPTGKLRS